MSMEHHSSAEAESDADIEEPVEQRPAAHVSLPMESVAEDEDLRDEALIESPVAEIPDVVDVAEDTVEEPVVNTWPDVSPEVDPGQPVPATPGTYNADAFIPKPAVNSSGKTDIADADPYAAAAMANGAGSSDREMPAVPKKAKGMSLFERVTGIGGLPKRTVPKLPENSTPMGALVDSSGAGAGKIEPLIQNKPAIVPLPEPALEQETLGGMDAGDRIQKSHPEEDLLDIPAFLRRQAN